MQAATFLPAEACQAVQLVFVPFGADSTVSMQEGESCFMKMSAAFSAATKYKDWILCLSIHPLAALSQIMLLLRIHCNSGVTGNYFPCLL